MLDPIKKQEILFAANSALESHALFMRLLNELRASGYDLDLTPSFPRAKPELRKLAVTNNTAVVWLEHLHTLKDEREDGSTN